MLSPGQTLSQEESGAGAELISVARSSQVNHSCPVGGAGEGLGEAKSESHLHLEEDTGSWYVSLLTSACGEDPCLHRSR